eukprot:jgi/Tetstr1/441744/TSEL_029965.t1
MQHKAGYWLRNCLPSEVEAFAEAVDATILAAVERVLGVSFDPSTYGTDTNPVVTDFLAELLHDPDPMAAEVATLSEDAVARARSRLHLPTRLKGAGIRRMATVRDAAFIGCMNAILPRFLTRNSGTNTPTPGFFDPQLGSVLGRGSFNANSSARQYDHFLNDAHGSDSYAAEMREAWGRLQVATAGHLGDADARQMEREVEAASGSQKQLTAFLDKANNSRLRNEVCALPATCRERILFNQLDAASGMWTVAIPTARTAMTPHELREVAAGYFFLPSPCLAPVVGCQIILPSTEHNPVIVDLYGDALMNLPAPGDAHWRVKHDAIAGAFRDHCVRDLGIAVRREVDDLFQQAVPLGNTVPRDELKDLVPDAELSLPAFNVVTGSYDPRSLKSTLLEFKTMRYGVKYTSVPRATAVDRFERSLLGDIQRGLAARDAAWHNTEPGQKGPLRDILDMSEYTGMVFGTVGEVSKGVHRTLTGTKEFPADGPLGEHRGWSGGAEGGGVWQVGAMLQRKSFVKKTKKGAVVKVVREHYLRDDISCGSFACGKCDQDSAKMAEGAKTYLVIDTNVALQQIDLLEHVAVEDVIVSSVVLQEVKHRGLPVYNRLRSLCQDKGRRFYVFSNEHHKETYIKAEPGESPNDRNDRAIRVVAAWYKAHLPEGSPGVLLLSNDVDCRRKAAEMGIDAVGVQEYARRRTDAPELQDLVAAGEAAENERDAAGEKGGKRKRVFEEHRPLSEITAGGALRTSRYNPYEARIASEAVGQDIIISGRVDMNRAMEGDIVAVELLPEAQWKTGASKLPSNEDTAEEEGNAGAEVVTQAAPGAEEGSDTGRRPTGKVVGIVKRSWRQRGYCGSLEPTKPTGRAGNSVLFVPVEKRFPRMRIQTRQAENLMDKRIVVAIDGWDVDSAYPSATTPFTPAVYACVPRLPWAVSEEDRQEPRREDLRHICVCSVDPPGCRDIDDALHARELPNGNWELGVHIADVTHFWSAMDLEAARRGTSVYLVERRIDMLPKALTEDICSLRAEVERLTFSVIWEITPPGARQHRRGGRPHALHQGCDPLPRRAVYQEAQLASPEVKFKLEDETLDPLDVRETNQMVEEMMLMANVAVAQKIVQSFPSLAVLRRHATPPPRQRWRDSLDNAVREDDGYFNKLIRIMTTRCMTQALYFCTGDFDTPEFHHYGTSTTAPPARPACEPSAVL